MSSSLESIRRIILRKETANSGEIIEIRRSDFVVATSNGVESVTRQPGDTTRYVVGARVRIRSGFLVSRLSAQAAEYFV